MQSVNVVSGSRGRLVELKAALSGHFEAAYLSLDDLPRSKPKRITVLDIDLRQSSQVQAVKIWLSARPANAQIIVGIDDKTSYLEVTQACAIGATSSEKLTRGTPLVCCAPSSIQALIVKYAGSCSLVKAKIGWSWSPVASYSGRTNSKLAAGFAVFTRDGCSDGFNDWYAAWVP